MKTAFNILVVDDDLKNIQVGINFLKQNKDYHLIFATSGEQALERVKETSFDLILLDILMPTMDGYEVCSRLKAEENTKHIPVIFLTAKNEEESLMKGFEVGGADYITKPFNAAELHARVKTHLDLHYYYHQEITKLKQLLMYSQKAETIKFIAGGVAHDCKNFLNVLPFNLHVLRKAISEIEQDKEQLLELIDGSKAAVGNISKLLDHFSSFSADTSRNSTPVDMNEVVSDLSKVYKDWERHKINFSIELLSQPAIILADKMHIEQVLLNLLINAQHAVLERMENEKSDDGSIRLIIEKEEKIDLEGLDPTVPYISISVRDNGIGMSPSVMDKIFDPYFSTRKDNGGKGLGLAVSQHIIHMHKGQIQVDSKQGKGTVFHMLLPYAQ